MSEVTFAKTFLATLDKRPIKLPADHVSDPRKYPSQSPFILPKNTHPFPTRSQPTSTSQAKDKIITATLKPMRAGSGEILSLPDITLDTTIHDLKTQYAARTGTAQDKIKLLLNKKPAADLKTLKELGVSGQGDVEVSVMVMGGGAGGTGSGVQSPSVEKTDPVPAPAGDKMDVDPKDPAPLSEKAEMEAERAAPSKEPTPREELGKEEFWRDLKGFLAQRLRSEEEGEKLVGAFREAWRKN